MSSKEKWKDVVGYEGHYEVSSFGNVRGKERKVRTGNNAFRLIEADNRKPRVNSRGYMAIDLRKDNISKTHKVHRLVAMAFLNNDENKPEVNHKDGVKTNNRLENLEWVTRSENIRHSLVNGLAKTKVSIQTVRKLRNFYERGMNIKLIANMLGVSKSQVDNILTSKSWSYVK